MKVIHEGNNSCDCDDNSCDSCCRNELNGNNGNNGFNGFNGRNGNLEQLVHEDLLEHQEVHYQQHIFIVI